MIGYVTIGVSDMQKAREFYGALFKDMGGEELFGFDRIKFYGKPGERVPDFFYGAYVRDADGNKLCFYKMT